MFYSISRFLKSKYAKNLSASEIVDLKYLTKIFPFKVSAYVLNELIDWDERDEDPIYRLTFPRRDMLTESHWEMLKTAKSTEEEKEAIRKIRRDLKPHPDDQTHNIPKIGNRSFDGIQHKYKETILFFPAQGQTCHSFCTYCFRWAQFVNIDEHKFRSKVKTDLHDYLKVHKHVTDVLFTGGDPMWMKNEVLFEYLDVIMEPELEHVTSIRLGTKSLSFHPERFLGEEGDALLNKLDSIVRRGKNVALMAHFSHPKELQTEKLVKAVNRLRDTGIVIRTQAPIIGGINDSPEAWRDMWAQSVALGMIPYYMFIARDTGAHQYFSVPLFEAYHIFTEAYSKISGLAKTVRGPSMSASPGKVLVSGVTGFGEDRKFILKFIQARNPELINKPFFARFDPEATWLDELEIESPMKEYLEGDSADFEEDGMQIDEVA